MPRVVGYVRARSQTVTWTLLALIGLVWKSYGRTLNRKKEDKTKPVTYVHLGQRRSWRICEGRNLAKSMDRGVEGRWSTGRAAKMSGGDAHRREGGIEADGGQVPTGVGLIGEMGPVVHDWGVATAHSRIRIVVEVLVEWSGDIDRRGWLGELVGCLREERL